MNCENQSLALLCQPSMMPNGTVVKDTQVRQWLFACVVADRQLDKVFVLLQVCQPCEAEDAPEAVKVVWKLVDEYTLMEAERAMLKLMRGLDKHLQHVKQTTAAAQATPAAGSTATAGAGQMSTAETTTTAAAQGPVDIAQITHPDQQSTQTMAGLPVWSSNQLLQGQSLPYAVSHTQQLQESSPMSVAYQAPQTLEAPSRVNSAEHLLQQQLAEHQYLRPNHGHLATVTVDQQREGPNTQQRLGRHTVDQQLDYRHPSSRQQQGRHTTSDLQLPVVGPENADALLLDRPVLVRAVSDGRKGKLEYRLSQDDVSSPTAAEIQALLQHGATNSSHHLQLPPQLQQQQPQLQQQQPQLQQRMSRDSSNSGCVYRQRVGCDQSHAEMMNGVADGAGSVAGSTFANPLVSSSMDASQGKAVISAEGSGMLSLVYKIQAVQV